MKDSNYKICSKCGAKMSDKTAFCTSCGSSMEEDFACPKCGKKVIAGTKFCPECGTPIPSKDEAKRIDQENDYGVAKNHLSAEHTIDCLKKAITSLEKVGEYEDAPLLLKEAKNELLELEYIAACDDFDKAKDNKSLYKKLEGEFSRFGDYKDSKEKCEFCKQVNTENAKKKKKKIVIAGGCLTGLIAIAITVVTVIIPSVKYNNAVASLAAGEYQNAINLLVELEDYKDSTEQLKEAYFEYGKRLISEKNYASAITALASAGNYDKAATYKSYAEGLKKLDSKDYTGAISSLKNAGTIEDAPNKLKEANYLNAKKLFNDKDYSSAKTYFSNAGDYSDAKDMINACGLMLAEQLCTNGELNAAKKAYDALPATYSYNGISVKARQKLLGSSSFVKACGKWTASKNYIETRNVYKRTGSWDSWYIDSVVSGQDITVKCCLNSNGTYTIKGSVEFFVYTDYTSLQAYLYKYQTYISKNFTISNVTSIPSSYKIDGNTTLKYSNGVFSISYTKYDYYSAHFYNKYSSSVTYGTRSTTY